MCFDWEITVECENKYYECEVSAMMEFGDYYELEDRSFDVIGILDISTKPYAVVRHETKLYRAVASVAYEKLLENENMIEMEEWCFQNYPDEC